MTVTEKMLDAYNDAYRAVIDAAMSDYSKGATVADDAKRAGIAAVLALSPPAEDGWVLVPREPDVEMIAAWYRCKNGHHFHDEPPPSDTSDFAAYRAMFTASPAPPVPVAQPVAVKPLEWLPAVIPTGWYLVPEVPTEEQMAAGLYQSSHDAEYADVCQSYMDMVRTPLDAPELYAAPVPPEQPDSEARNAELEVALEPFARIGAELNGAATSKPDDRTIWGFNNSELTYGDFRRARSLIAKEPTDG